MPRKTQREQSPATKARTAKNRRQAQRQRPRDPGFTLIRRYEPDAERQVEALALVLGIRLAPPPTPRPFAA